MFSYLLRFLLLGLALSVICCLSSCNDHCDKIDAYPSVYDGPHGGENHQPQGEDEDYCDCRTAAGII